MTQNFQTAVLRTWAIYNFFRQIHLNVDSAGIESTTCTSLPNLICVQSFLHEYDPLHTNTEIIDVCNME